MIPTTTTAQHLDELSLMSDAQYVAYQQALEDQLTDRYPQGLPFPGLPSMPSSLAALVPPF